MTKISALARTTRQVTIATALVAGALGAHAQSTGLSGTSGFYGGLSLAKPSWSDGVNGISGSNGGTGLKLYGGWRVTPNFALELGSAQLGHQSDGTNEAKARGVFLDGVGTLPLSSEWNLLGRVGLADMKTVTTLGSDRGTALKVGAGAEYKLTKTVALRGEWERYRLSAFGDHPKADQFSLGVNFGF